jgi:prolyl 4-hydroxylase
MAWLNAVEDGGETEFTDLGFSIPPQPGALLLWNNATPKGAPNPLTRHAGKPVLRGRKYIITKWFRTRRWG